MKLSGKLIYLVVMFFGSAIFAMSATINVPSDQSTIQDGIAAAVDYDTVMVAPGTYNGHINFNGKLIVVKSSDGPLETIITGDAVVYSALVTFNSGETSEAVLEGFTLLGGWLGVYCEGSGPTINYNILKDQHTTEWAAISLAAPGYPPGAGIGPAPAVIINNTIINSANGGISSFSTEAPIIKNNIIAFNAHYGIHLQSVSLPIEFSYNDLYGNGVNYLNLSHDSTSISEDPDFVLDYRLSQASPCIDAGDPDPLYNDPDGSRNDMGALPSGENFLAVDNINFGPDIANLSIPTLIPEIFWSYLSYPETEQQQYEIEVGTDDDWSVAEMWAPGPVSSNETSVVYNGLPLTDRGAYYLRIRVSDGSNWSSWEQEMFIIHTTIITVNVPLDFASIQEGIDYALNGDTVLVAPGTYEGLINFDGKLIVVRSSDGPLQTVITGSDSVYSALVTFNHGETQDAVLEGFTLLEGWLGVYCEGSGPTIKFNLLKNQHTTEWAAINLAAPGYPPSARSGPAPAVIVNNTIVNCANGGISSFSTEAPVIRNNIIAFNGGYGIHLQKASYPSILAFNDVYGNSVNYINVYPDSGSISDDPLFNPDFTLAPNSPCIDAGDPDAQYNDPDGSRSDMGALPIVNNYPFAANLNFGAGVNPNAVPTLTPEFFWTYIDPDATMQQQYEIEVGTDDDWSVAEMWASGPVYSGDTSAVYDGTPLEERVPYFVRIRVSDGETWGGWNMKEFKVRTSFVTILVPGDYETIQGAIDASDDGDTVLVAPGTYDGLINFNGKLIVVRSNSGPLMTVITGSDSMYSALVTFNHGETQDAVLEGFTLLEGWLGVYCENSGPTIRYNLFRDQHTTEWAAINLAGSGYPPSAGIGPAPAVIINNTIVNCTNGGISSFSNEVPIIKNNIIAFNGGYGIHLQDSALSSALSYNDVYGNPIDYINAEAGFESISADPLFDENFNLTEGSPCIDAGDPDPLYNDPDGSRNDMGALAVGGFIPGDANNDDALNIMDAVCIIKFLYKDGSLPEPQAQADANGDSAINLLDVVVLVNYLYRSGPPPTSPN